MTREGVYACPGVNGGELWSSPAFHPGARLLIAPAVDNCGRFTAAEEVQYVPGQLYMGGGFGRDEEMTGWLTAMDVETGAVRWKYHDPLPMVAAVTTTAGGLVVSGSMTGDLLFLDVESGEVLKRIHTGAEIGGGIISYAVDGKQYIAVGTGTAMLTIRPGKIAPRDGSVIVYAIP